MFVYKYFMRKPYGHAIRSSIIGQVMDDVATAIHSELGLHGLGRSCGHSHLANTVTKREMR